MSLCKHCGSEVGADAKYCSSCGKRLNGEMPDMVSDTTSVPIGWTASEDRAALIQELLRTISDDEAVDMRHRLEAYHLAMAAYKTVLLDQSDPFSLENWETVEAALAAKYGLPDGSILRLDEPTKK